MKITEKAMRKTYMTQNKQDINSMKVIEIQLDHTGDTKVHKKKKTEYLNDMSFK